jgi:hypothetical protein
LRKTPRWAKLLAEFRIACKTVIAIVDDDENRQVQVIQEGDEVGGVVREE